MNCTQAAQFLATTTAMLVAALILSLVLNLLQLTKRDPLGDMTKPGDQP